MSLVAITSSSPSIMSSSSPPSDPRTRPMASTYQRPSQLAYQVNNCYGNNYGQQVPSFLITNAADNTSSVPRKDSRNETILSGQFMVSEISEETDSGVQVGTDEADHEYNSDYGESGTGTINSAIVSPVNSEVKSMDLTTECMETTTKYQGKSGFQSVTIDKSLSKLFHCMSLAYSGKLTSPKWKSFKGLRLKLKDKIRLNNIIWRAWHMQYIKGRDKPPFFQFSTTSDVHNKPEAILLEGKYWKRGSGTVVAEYRKWRSFNHKTKSQSTSARFSDSHDQDAKHGQNMTIEYYPTDGSGMIGSASYDDDFVMDFTDNSLFNSLCMPGSGDYVEFPNPREIARSGFGADCIQPGLTQLQPSMDNYMDITFEPFQEFMSRTLSILPPLLEEPQNQLDLSGQQQPTQYSMYQPQQQQQPQLSYNPSNSSNNFVQQQYGQQQPQQSTNQSSPPSNSNPVNTSNNLISNLQQQQQPQTTIIYPSSSISSSAASSVPSSASPSSSAGTNLIHYRRNLQTAAIKHSPVEVYNAYQSSAVSGMVPKQEGVQQQEVVRSNNSTFVMPSIPLSTVTKMSRMNTRSGRSNQDNNCVQQQQQDVVVQQIVDQQQQQQSVPTYQSPQQQQQYNFSNSQQQQSFSNQQSSDASSFSPPATGLTNVLQFSNSSNDSQSNDRNITTQANNIIAQLLTSNTSTSSLINQLNNSNSHSRLQSQLINTSFGGNQVANRFPTASDLQSRTSQQQQLLVPSSSANNLSGHQPQLTSRHAIRFDPGINQRSVAALRSEGMTSSVDDINSFVGTSSRSSASGGGGGPVRKISSPARICSPHPLATVTAAGAGGASTRRSNSSRELSPSPLTLSHASSLGALSSAHHGHHHHRLGDAGRRHGSVSPGHSSSGGSPAHHGHERQQHREHRRVSHINAEQKRRCNIKNGFDTLRSILPSMSAPSSSSSSQKVSKATMLNKAADYIQQLKSEQAQHKRLFEMLRAETELLARQIREFQDQLPATGAPVHSVNRTGESRSQFELYVRDRTRQNWKFWVFSLFVEPLFESFEANVSSRSVEDMSNSMLSWLDSSCSLMTLRRDVQDSLVHLSTTSSILTDPSRLPSEAIQSVNERDIHHSNQS